MAEGGVLGTLADQDAGPKGLFVDFFNRPASTHKAVALLALEHQVTIIVTATVRTGGPFQYQTCIEDVIDPADYAEDSFDNMRAVARQFRYPFPYVWDESQEVAKAYGAVCTPDFFGFNADLELQYRGRLDASRKETAPPDVPRDLFEAMVEVARTGRGPLEQIPSIGCSIKWRGVTP